MSATTTAAASRARANVLRSEWTWLAAVSVAVAALYVVLRAPVFDPGDYLDPWIYTALFVNFKFIYQTWNWAYYTSRLPWLLPGIAVHAVLGPVAAFFVLHGIFFFSAGLFAYLTIRRFYGPVAALATYVLLIASPLFYGAYVTDYPDGALLTFLFGGVYFGLTAEGSRRPLLRAALSGFFLAAAAGTNLFSCIVIVFLLMIYAVVRVRSRAHVRGVAYEVGAALGGALVLLIALGSFAKAYGGPFLFFMPSVRAASSIDTGDYKATGYAWLWHEPQMMLPLFLVAAAAIAYARSARGERGGERRRFALGAALSLGTFFALLAVWEFAFTGDFLETSYYFSLFNVGMTFCIGAVLGSLWPPLEARGVKPLQFVLAACVIAAAPLLLVEGLSVLPSGRPAVVACLVLMTAVLGLLLVSRAGHGQGWAVLVATACLFVFAAGYAAAAGTNTDHVYFQRGAFSQRRDVQSVAFQLIDFMRTHRLQSGAPAFWYNPREDSNLNGIQSTYLWGTTWVGLDMPKVDSAMRSLLESRKPATIVLLCKHESCRGGPEALRRAGYKPRPAARGVLQAGAERVVVRAFTLPRFAALARRADPVGDYYRATQSAFAATAPAAPLRSWSFDDGAPQDWSGAAADDSRTAAGGPFDTSSRRWNYELESPKLNLQPGTYAISLRGNVVAGGLDLGVLDSGTRKWLVQSLYWYRQRGFDRGWMAARLTLSQPTTVQVVLSNWVPSDQRSRWQLGELRVARSS